MSKNKIPKKSLKNIDEDYELTIYGLNEIEITRVLDIIEETQPNMSKELIEYINNIDLGFKVKSEPVLFDRNHILLLVTCINGLSKRINELNEGHE